MATGDGAGTVLARYGEPFGDGGVECGLCPHRCRLERDAIGHCRVRCNRAGQLVLTHYGLVAMTAVDAIERRGLYHLLPGEVVLSVGSAGCNLTCAYCLNYRVSQEAPPVDWVAPAELVARARQAGAAGIAFTYNEPVVWIEYVLDVAHLARAEGLAVVLKSNGYVEPAPLADLLPCVDGINIDLKGADELFYGKVCGGQRAPVLRTLEQCVGRVHLEVTYLVIPGENDADEALDATAEWIATRLGRQVPTHLLAYFPRWRMTAPATPVTTLTRARARFGTWLDHVYFGDDYVSDARDTCCPKCGTVWIRRRRETVEVTGLTAQGACARCGCASTIRR